MKALTPWYSVRVVIAAWQGLGAPGATAGDSAGDAVWCPGCGVAWIGPAGAAAGALSSPTTDEISAATALGSSGAAVFASVSLPERPRYAWIGVWKAVCAVATVALAWMIRLSGVTDPGVRPCARSAFLTAATVLAVGPKRPANCPLRR